MPSPVPDVSLSDITQRLTSLGAVIFSGHQASHLRDADVVVTSTAVKDDNPEVLEAHRRNIPVIPRAEMLAELLKMKFSVAVSGIMAKQRRHPWCPRSWLMVDSIPPWSLVEAGQYRSNAKIGDGEIIVAEADESDGSFSEVESLPGCHYQHRSGASGLLPGY